MTHDINRHADEGTLEKFSMGSLPEREAARFEEHLLICEHCQQRLAETDRYVAAMQRGAARLRRPPVFPGELRSPWNWLRVIPALAATALLVLVIGWWSGKSDMTGAPPFALSLVATRGSGVAAYAPAGTWLLVRLDLAGLPESPSYRLEMVDSAGARVWQAEGAAHDAKVESKIPGTQAGVYFIRVYSPLGELLREFGVKIRDR